MIPESVKVGPHTYSVGNDDRELRIAGREMDADLIGHSDHVHLRITVESGLAHSLEQETVLHEVLHCVFSITNLADELNEKDEGNEEKFIQRISPLLLQVIQENPELMRYLYEKEADSA